MISKSSKKRRKKVHGFMSRREGLVTSKRIAKGRWKPAV